MAPPARKSTTAKPTETDFERNKPISKIGYIAALEFSLVKRPQNQASQLSGL